MLLNVSYHVGIATSIWFWCFFVCSVNLCFRWSTQHWLRVIFDDAFRSYRRGHSWIGPQRKLWQSARFCARVSNQSGCCSVRSWLSSQSVRWSVRVSNQSIRCSVMVCSQSAWCCVKISSQSLRCCTKYSDISFFHICRWFRFVRARVS